MSTTITVNGTTISPVLVDGWKSDQESRNVIHHVLGRPDPDVTLRTANLRTGTFSLFFTSASAAEIARLAHVNPAVFNLISSDLPQANMRYIVDGNISAVLEDDLRKYWYVTVDYQEVG